MNRVASTLALGVALAATAVSTPARADSLDQATRLLCSTSTVAVCASDGECETGPAWALNIPDFVVVDLEARSLSTTETSFEARTTPIDRVRREDGLILLEGLEQGRAFSIAITEDIGSLSGAIILEELVVTVFGACMPMPSAD
jgi:hypothetical protein